MDPNDAGKPSPTTMRPPAVRTVELDADADHQGQLSEAAAGDGVFDDGAPAVNAAGDAVGAHQISGFDFTKTRRGGLPAEWFNGQQWKLTPAVLGRHPKRKQMYLKTKALRDFNVLLNTAFDEHGNLIIQAVKPKKSDKNPLRVKAAKERLLAKKAAKKPGIGKGRAKVAKKVGGKQARK